MTTFNALDADGLPVALEKPLPPGRAAAAFSRPVALSTEDLAALTALHTDLATTIAGFVDGLEGYVDGLEGLVTSSNTKLDTIHTDLGTTLSGLLTDLKGYTDQLEGYVDGLETLVTSSNTKLDTLHTDMTSATPAGTNLIGKVKTKFIVATGSTLTRPANQTAYTANDAISDNATPGSVAAKTITVADVNNEPVTIERVRLVSTDTGIAAKAVRMWLYNSDPTASSGVSGGDNLAFSNKQAGFIGTLSGTFRTFSDGSTAVLVPDEGSRIISLPGSSAQTIWWQLQALEAFTPSANSTTFIPTAEGFQGGAN